MSLRPFDVRLRNRVVFGPGTLARLGELARSLPATRVALVTDPGLVACGIAARARESLESAGCVVQVYDQVREDPSESDVAAARAAIHDPEALVAVGGGSSIDTAKGVNFLIGGGGAMRDYRGPATARGPLLPLIAVPTTAGTGSEMQSYALISEDGTHRKMACGDPRAVPAIALLDPDLTLTLPRRVTAAAGADALVHALECAVTRTRSSASLLYAHESFRLIYHHLDRALADPSDADARAAMLLGAAWAGVAIELSMLGAAHAAANPLSARYHTVHGHAVALMAPHVVRYNQQSPEAADAYGELASTAGLHAARLADTITDRIAAAGLPVTLAAAGIADPDVDALAADAATQWTGKHNPREIDAAGFAALYRAAR